MSELTTEAIMGRVISDPSFTPNPYMDLLEVGTACYIWLRDKHLTVRQRGRIIDFATEVQRLQFDMAMIRVRRIQPRPFTVGDVVVRGRPDLVEEILDINERGYYCRALYLGKRFATDVVYEHLDDARLATPEDHEQARAYAEKFNSQDKDNT